ncbi:DsbA family protein [Noviherbaspirillum cavernae]|uniref:DsbA family protein n=1 Tax=Noviherbaspirillum cavernae TaxID=2320862 RepID=A0A418X4M5_9BURK|nr:DsbA family protein [Noviherbaspirillum cavernae]RJG07424.1 DsbA family protein [Noviherbaspirillum cavernae]
MTDTLHYIYDPLCGWCYAAEPLLEQLFEALQAAAPAGLAVQLHGGGLFQRTQLPAATREHIRVADQRIGQLSGQPFGDAYLNGLLADPATIYDSAPTISAILAAQALRPGSGPAMLKAIQHAHYRAGRRVVEPQVLADLAASIGLEQNAFSQAYEASIGAPTHRHVAGTRQLMDRTGVRGFPSFVLQTGERLEPLRHEAYYGKPEAFALLVSERLRAA